jgi:ABC-type methionine transport system ATPase subunit
MAAAISPASTAHQPFVRLDRASKKYGAFRLALSDVSLDIERSEFVLVLGASGAGKSTLLRLMSALEAPSSGSVRIGGEDPVRMRPNERAFLRRSIGVVLQEPLLLDRRSVLDASRMSMRCPASCRAAPAVRSHSPAPSSTARPCCWSMIPSATSTLKVPAMSCNCWSSSQ